MKKACKILTILGIIYNSIVLLGYVIRTIFSQRLAYITYNNIDGSIPSFLTFEIFKVLYLMALIFEIVFYTACLVMVSISFAHIQKDTSKKLPHILIIVSGALTSNPLYIVAGILGVINSSKEKKDVVEVEVVNG